MPRIAGIATQKNSKGELTHLTINVKKHKEMVAPLMMQLCPTEKTQFEKDWERGITIEEVRKKSHEFIRKMWKKYYYYPK